MESGESIEVPVVETSKSGVHDGDKPGVDTRDEVKHNEWNDLLFVVKMIQTEERV